MFQDWMQRALGTKPINVFAAKTYDTQHNTNDTLLYLKGDTTERICRQIPGTGFLMHSSSLGGLHRACFQCSNEKEGTHIQCFYPGTSIRKSVPPGSIGDQPQRCSLNRPIFFTPINKVGVQHKQYCLHKQSSMMILPSQFNLPSSSFQGLHSLSSYVNSFLCKG